MIGYSEREKVDKNAYFGLSNDVMTIIRTKEGKVVVEKDGEKQEMLSLDQNVTIYTSAWTRGFYVDQPYFSKENTSISLDFVNFDG